MFDIALKMGITIIAILIIAEISKRLGSSLGGILFGLPLGAGLNIYFVYAEYGSAFTLHAVPWGIGGLSCTLIFGLFYVLAGRIRARNSRIGQILVSTLCASAAYFAAAALIRALHPGFALSILLVLLLSALTVCCLTLLEVPRHMTGLRRDSFQVLLTRGLTAGLVVVTVTAVAGRVGPAWTGLFSAFPAMLLPLIVVLHWEEGGRLYPGVIFGFAFSVLNLITFYLLLAVLLDRLPFALLYLLVYAVSALVLWLLNTVKNRYLALLAAHGVR